MIWLSKKLANLRGRLGDADRCLDRNRVEESGGIFSLPVYIPRPGTRLDDGVVEITSASLWHEQVDDDSSRTWMLNTRDCKDVNYWIEKRALLLQILNECIQHYGMLPPS